MPRKRRHAHKRAAKGPVESDSETSVSSPSEASPKKSFKEKAESILSVTGSGSSCIETFPKLHDIMEKLIEEQKSQSLSAKISADPLDRLKVCSDLLESMGNRSVDCSGVTVADFGIQGLGLKAERAFEKHEVILRIPRDTMMTSGDAMESEIGDFLKMDPVCLAMPPIALALFLLHERFKEEDSKWAAYIQSLPQRFGGCLYVSKGEFQMLKGSPIQEKIGLDFRRMCRQYAIFALELERCKEAKNITFREQFTWEDFRWAVSAVLSRNNPIPRDAVSSAIGLVPVWDMGNHEFGEMSTDYDLETKHLVFHAMRNFAKDEQIVFHYGNRSNSDLFMYSGFAVDQNPFDRFPLKLGISANDVLRERRMHFLKKFNIDSTDAFYLDRDKNIFTENILVFARIFVMKEEDLQQLDEWPPEQLSQPLVPASGDQVPEDRARINADAASFLRQRFKLLRTVLDHPRDPPNTEVTVQLLKVLDGHASLLVDALEILGS